MQNKEMHLIEKIRMDINEDIKEIEKYLENRDDQVELCQLYIEMGKKQGYLSILKYLDLRDSKRTSKDIQLFYLNHYLTEKIFCSKSVLDDTEATGFWAFNKVEFLLYEKYVEGLMRAYSNVLFQLKKELL